MKKILIFIGLILVTVGIGYAMYSLFFKGPEVVVELPPTDEEVLPPGVGLPSADIGVPTTIVTPIGELPEIELPPGVSAVADGGVTLVTPVVPVRTVGASVSSGGNLNFYNSTDQRFYRLGDDGTMNLLSSKEFFNVDEATFDPAGEKAVVEYPDGSNILYDFTSDTQVTLPRHWEDFGFNPTGDELLSKSIGLDPSNRFLVISNPDGSSAVPVQELGENADKVEASWSPNNQIVGIAATGNDVGGDGTEIFFVGKNQENFKSLKVQGLGFESQWTPKGDRLLYSTTSALNDYKPSIWLVDAQGANIGRNRKPLNINTWVDKCTFSDDNTVYCAVPTELPRGAGLQPRIADTIDDELWRIDLSTGLRTKIAIPEGSHTIDTLMITPDEDKLFFVDKGTGIINQIELK